MEKWAQPRPNPTMGRMDKRMSLRFSDAEWEELTALQGTRSLSDAVRELVRRGIKSIAERERA